MLGLKRKSIFKIIALEIKPLSQTAHFAKNVHKNLFLPQLLENQVV